MTRGIQISYEIGAQIKCLLINVRKVILKQSLAIHTLLSKMKASLHAKMDTLTHPYIKIKSGLNIAITRCRVVSVFFRATQYLVFMIVNAENNTS